VISTKEFDVFKGMSGSKNVGISNYSELFNQEGFSGVIWNTVTLGTLSILLTCILAAMLIICISKLRWRWLKTVSIAVLAIPAFIPVTSFVWVFSSAFSAQSGFITKLFTSPGTQPRLLFAEPALYPLLFAIMDSLRSVFIPVIIGVLVCEYGQRLDFGRIGFVIIGYIAARATMLMSPDIENILNSSNPLIVKTSEVLDSLQYRAGFALMQYSFAGAAWVLKTIIQLVINIAVFYVLYALMPAVTKAVDRLSKKAGSVPGTITGVIGYVLFAAGSITMLILTFLPASGGLSDGIRILLSDRTFVISFANTFIYAIFGCIMYGFMAFMLACPLSTGSKAYPFLLIILLSLSNNFIGEYLLFRSLGMIDTAFPVIISSGLSIAGAFALHFCVCAKLKQSSFEFADYVKASLLPLLTLVLIAFIANWGGYLYQMLYTARADRYGIGMYGRMLLYGGPSAATQNSSAGKIVQLDPMVIKSAFVFISSIVPAVLGAVLIALNKFLPLTAFTAQVRKG
jgi:putative aldouronate transport system permease protein